MDITNPIARLRTLFFLRCCEAAYEDSQPLREGTLSSLGLTEVERFGDGHLLVAECKECIVIAIKGTVDGKDVLTDLDALLVPLYPSKSIIDWSDVLVHQGFVDTFHQTCDLVEKLINSLNPVGQPFRPIYITGHSLGGAVATIYALHLQLASYQTQLYTFGSPRVGNKEFIKTFHAHHIPSLRVVCGDDVITKAPGFPYRHVVGLCHLGYHGQLIGPISKAWRWLKSTVGYFVRMLRGKALLDHELSAYRTTVTWWADFSSNKLARDAAINYSAKA